MSKYVKFEIAWQEYTRVLLSGIDRDARASKTRAQTPATATEKNKAQTPAALGFLCYNIVITSFKYSLES